MPPRPRWGWRSSGSPSRSSWTACWVNSGSRSRRSSTANRENAMDALSVYLPIAQMWFSIPLLLGLGFCVGVLGGFLGVGGAWIVTPALNIFGFNMSFAIGTDLGPLFGKSIVATRKHGKMGNVDVKMGLLSIVGSVVGVEVGARNVMWLTAK